MSLVWLVAWAVGSRCCCICTRLPALTDWQRGKRRLHCAARRLLAGVLHHHGTSRKHTQAHARPHPLWNCELSFGPMGSWVQVLILSPSCLTEGAWCRILPAAQPLTASSNRRAGRRFIAAVRGLDQVGGSASRSHGRQATGRFAKEGTTEVPKQHASGAGVVSLVRSRLARVSGRVVTTAPSTVTCLILSTRAQGINTTFNKTFRPPCWPFVAMEPKTSGEHRHLPKPLRDHNSACISLSNPVKCQSRFQGLHVGLALWTR